MSTYEAPDASRFPYSTLDKPGVAVGLFIASVVLFAVVAGLLAMLDGGWTDRDVPGVARDCSAPDCIAPRQLITASSAAAMKRRLANHALIVDISAVTEGTAFGSDLKAPFVERETESGTTFRMDFADRIDAAVRAVGMGHDEPVILVSTSLGHSILAALLLQERGYSNVLLVKD